MAVSAIPAATAATGNKATPASASSQLQATEDRFLTLLVAQMKNQDPLNPLDNAQVTSQMAALSTVQGVNKMNDQLTQLLAEFQGLQAMTLAGRSVLVPGNAMTLNAATATTPAEARGGFELATAASGVRVQVKDASGTVVRTIDLGPREAGVGSFRWDGKKDDGTAAPAGNYTFTVAAGAGGKEVASRPLAAVRVEGIGRDPAGGIQLDLGSRGTYAFGDVLQVL